MMDKSVIKNILKVIRDNNSFFIACHARPDGDAIGGQLALASFMKRLGKSVCAATRDRVPAVYKFLPGSKDIKTASTIADKFDAAFILDCPNLSRIERIMDVSRQVKLVVNIDHHVENGLFGNYNYVEEAASSVSELVYNIIKQSSLEINEAEAECIYVGMLTDTNRFQESNTSAESHLIAADLIKRGVSVSKITNFVYRSVSLNSMKLLKEALETLELSPDKRIATIVISQEMFKKTGTSSEDIEGVVNYAREIKGVDVGILFKETTVPCRYKISLRSRKDIDVNSVAKVFDGGGHRNASGCLVNGDLVEVKEKVLRVVEEGLDIIYDA